MGDAVVDAEEHSWDGSVEMVGGKYQLLLEHALEEITDALYEQWVGDDEDLRMHVLDAAGYVQGWLKQVGEPPAEAVERPRAVGLVSDRSLLRMAVTELMEADLCTELGKDREAAGHLGRVDMFLRVVWERDRERE